MAREINLTDIGDHFGEKVQTVVRKATLKATKDIKEFTPVFSLDNYPDLDSIPNFFTLPNGQVVPFKKALLDRGTGGQLRESWQTRIGKFQGEVFTNVEYAEPVAYGTNLPPSWGGQYRTRQQTIKGYPELIAKQLERFITDEFRRE
tara:strand:- start:328 stop:768 length:441 start_codon:yes stop_codon:yes gene_type:complete